MDRSDIKTNTERRLQSFGYETLPSDDWTLNFITDKVENYIKGNCNVSIVPNELFQVEIDMICGEFLNFKKNSGTLDLDKFNFDIIEKSIQEGDTKVEFYTDGTMTNEQKFIKLTDFLMSEGKKFLVSYRCLKW